MPEKKSENKTESTSKPAKKKATTKKAAAKKTAFSKKKSVEKKVTDNQVKTDVEPGGNITRQRVPSQMLLAAPMNATVFQTRRKTVTINPTDIPLETYEEMLLDPGVLYPLTILKLPTLRSEFIYTNPDKDIEEFVRETMRPIWHSLKTDCLTAYEYGFSAIEKRFYRDHNNMARYRKGVAILPKTVKMVVDNNGALMGIIQAHHRLREPVEVPIWKLFVYTHQKKFGNHYGLPRLRTAYNPWVLDMEMLKFHGIAAQDHAVPTIITRAPLGRGTFTNERGEDVSMNFLDFMQSAGESVHSNSTVSYPSGEEFSLEALDIKQSSHWDFIKDHNYFDSAKAKAIFSFEEITKAGGGSYAKTKEIGGWLIEGIESIQEEIAVDYILPYMIRPLVMWNFWDGGPVKPPIGEFNFSPFTRNVRTYLESIFKEVIKGKIDSVDINELARVLSVPIKDNYEEDEGEKKDDGKFTSQRHVEESLKRAYNASLSWAKEEEGCDNVFIPQPKDDVNYLRELAKSIWGKIKSGSIDNLGINREFKKVNILAQQRVLDFLDNRTIEPGE